MDTDRYPEAIKAWEDVVDWLECHGFNEAVAWPKTEIGRLKKLSQLDPATARAMNAAWGTGSGPC